MVTTEEDLKRVNQGKDSWFRRDGETLYCHYFDGLNGNRCRIQTRPFIAIRSTLTWDTTDCPDCLALKRPTEPWTVQIDTRGD